MIRIYKGIMNYVLSLINVRIRYIIKAGSISKEKRSKTIQFNIFI